MKSYITTEIDVEVRDIFTSSIKLGISEIKEFFESCTNEDKLELRAALKLTDFSSYGKTLIDTMKFELVHEAMSKFSLDELEARLK